MNLLVAAEVTRRTEVRNRNPPRYLGGYDVHGPNAFQKEMAAFPNLVEARSPLRANPPNCGEAIRRCHRSW